MSGRYRKYNRNKQVKPTKCYRRKVRPTSFYNIPVEVHRVIAVYMDIYTLEKVLCISRFTKDVYSSPDTRNIKTLWDIVKSKGKELFLPEILDSLEPAGGITTGNFITENVFVDIYNKQKHFYNSEMQDYCKDYALHKYRFQTVYKLFPELGYVVGEKNDYTRKIIPILFAPNRNDKTALQTYISNLSLASHEALKKMLAYSLIYVGHLDLLQEYFPNEEFIHEHQIIQHINSITNQITALNLSPDAKQIIDDIVKTWVMAYFTKYETFDNLESTKRYIHATIRTELLEQAKFADFDLLVDKTIDFSNGTCLEGLVAKNNLDETAFIHYIKTCNKCTARKELVDHFQHYLSPYIYSRNLFNAYNAMIQVTPSLKLTNRELVGKNRLFLSYLSIDEIKQLIESDDIIKSRVSCEVLAETCKVGNPEKIKYMYRIFNENNAKDSWMYSYGCNQLFRKYPLEVINRMHKVCKFECEFQDMVTIDLPDKLSVFKWYNNTFGFTNKEKKLLLRCAVRWNDYYLVKWILDLGVKPTCRFNAAAKCARDKGNLRIFLLLFRYSPFVLEPFPIQSYSGNNVDEYVCTHELHKIMWSKEKPRSYKLSKKERQLKGKYYDDSD